MLGRTSSSRMWQLGILIGCIVLAQADVCPENCYCYDEIEDGLRVANCSITALITQRGPVNVEVVNFFPPKYHSFSLNSATFKHFRSMKYLTMSGLKIRRVPQDSFNAMKHLLEIDLSYNEIKHVNGLAYKDLKSLRGLYLRGNPLQMIVLDVIVSKSLKELDLGYCGLPDLASGIFDQLPALTHLYLDGNLLTTLTFSLLPSGLTYLNLANNKIADVPVKVLGSLRSLTRLDLSENPINCTCSLLIMQDHFARDAKVIENHATCSSPPRYAGKRLNELDENELCKMEFMPNPSSNSLKHHLRTKNPSKYNFMQGDQGNVQSDQPMAYDDYHGDANTVGNSEEEDAVSEKRQSTEIDDPQDITPTETLDEPKETEKTESNKELKETLSMEGKDNDIGFGTVSLTSKEDNSKETTWEMPRNEENLPTSETKENFTITEPPLGNLTHDWLVSDQTDYSYDATHSDYSGEMSTEPTFSSDSFEGSGDSGVYTEARSTYKFLEEQENETTTENYSVENVTDVFDSYDPSSSPSTENTVEITTLLSSSEPVSSSSEPSVSSSSEPSVSLSSEAPTSVSSEPSVSSSTEPSVSSSSEPSVSSEPTEPTTETPLFVDIEDKSSSLTQEETTDAPIDDKTSTFEPIIEPEIIKSTELFNEKENMIESKEGFSKEEKHKDAVLVKAIAIYTIGGLVIVLLVVLVLVSFCRKKKTKSISLPVDPEATSGTELQDMLLPKPPENGIKVVPKNYTNGNTANGKAEQKEEQKPVLGEDDGDADNEWGDQLGPIETVKARMCVLARPQTPIFIHKSLN